MQDQLGLTILAQTQVQAIHPEDRQVVCTDRTVSYSRLVLATGALPRVPVLDGDASDVCLAVNDLAGYQALYERLQNRPSCASDQGNALSEPQRIGILGAGLIGCEFANDLQVAGHQVSTIDPGGWPLGRLVPEAIGSMLSQALQALQALGVTMHAGRVCQRIDHQASRYAITLDDGSVHNVDHVVSAIGLVPNTQLARSAGLQVDQGVVVDAFLQTSDPFIYALGDCAQVHGGVLPYVMPIMQCGRALAQTLSGQPTRVRYPAMPIVTKTPALPLAICPAMQTTGEWHIDALDTQAIRAFQYDAQGNPVGFIVGGRYVNEHREHVKAMPAWSE